MYDCNGTGAQQWTVGTDGTVKALGKCMDVTAAGVADGSKVQLYDCNGSGAQVWQHQSNGQLVNPVSGKCLDAAGPSSANGTRLQIWTCYGSANQQWTTPADMPGLRRTGRTSSGIADRCAAPARCSSPSGSRP